MRKIEVVEYDPKWKMLFEIEAKEIKRILGENCVAVNHIGSTSVEGLAAKPVIDIMPVVYDVSKVDALDAEFEKLGYECCGEFGIPGRRFYRKGGDDRTHHIHIFEEQNSLDVDRHLAVRDYLRCHPEMADDYAEIKKQCAAEFTYDNDGYCQGKDAFVKNMEQKALAWYKEKKQAMTDIQNRLFELKDEKNAKFQAKLTPTLPEELFLGVRVPEARKLAKAYFKEPEHEIFLQELPHKYYDENVLHGLLVSEIKEYDKCIEEMEKFLPYVDNWGVCDIISPKVFKKHKVELIGKIYEWSKSEKTYTCRFGLGMLMKHFLDDDFKAEYLELPAEIKSEEYYVNMMIAWFFATALAKQWNVTISYIEERRLSEWTHRKTIQKACESYRVTDEQKAYLRSLK